MFLWAGPHLYKHQQSDSEHLSALHRWGRDEDCARKWRPYWKQNGNVKWGRPYYLTRFISGREKHHRELWSSSYKNWVQLLKPCLTNHTAHFPLQRLNQHHGKTKLCLHMPGQIQVDEYHMCWLDAYAFGVPGSGITRTKPGYSHIRRRRRSRGDCQALLHVHGSSLCSSRQ